MTALCLLLLVGEVSAPLGPYARPGVPVVLEVKGESEIVVEGWRYKADAITIIHPPVVPCVIRSVSGEELLRLEAVPEGRLLVGIVGDAPPDLELECEPGSFAVLVPGLKLSGLPWRALDVFDHILAPPVLGQEEPLLEWLTAGGAVTAVGEATVVRPPWIPRLGNVRPEVYDLLEPPRGRSRAHDPARLIVLAAAAISALQLVLGAFGMLSLRAALSGCAVIAVVGAGIAAITTRAAYEDAEQSRLRVIYYDNDGGILRVRVFTAYTAVAPSASIRPEAGQAPVFYRAAGDPWWTDAERTCRFDRGVIRLFSSEQTRWPEPEPENAAKSPLQALVPLVRPRRPGWRVVVSAWEGRHPREAVLVMRPQN